MQEGQSIVELAKELERQKATRKDYIAPMSKLTFEADDEDVYVAGLPTPDPVKMTPWTHGQVASHFKIPKPYYDRMREAAPDLLATNLMRWKSDEPEVRRMVRTLDGDARAWVSDSYRCLNNEDMAAFAFPTLTKRGAIIRSAAITDTRLYIKATIPSLEARVTHSKHVGDVLRGGVVLRNSEVGNGALSFAFFTERLVCTNGMTSDTMFRKAHLGRRLGKDLQEATELFSDRTRKLDDAAFFSKLKDVMEEYLQPKYIEEIAHNADRAALKLIDKNAKLEEVVECAAGEVGLPLTHTDQILHNLIQGGDLSVWGVANAMTRTAEDVEDYEVASALEAAGGKIIELKDDSWEYITAA